MARTPSVRAQAAARPPFAVRHPWDRPFLLVWVLLIWAAVLIGFVPEIVSHIRNGAPPQPMMVRAHGTAFVGWMVLLTVQLFLIRHQKVRLHRWLGVAGAVLAALMVVLGIGVALVVQHSHLGGPQSNPGFFSVQLLDMVEFGGLVTAAVLTRGQPAAHKRLMLLATLSIADAGFSRWLGIRLYDHLGEGYWQFWVELFGGSGLLIAGIGIYDWITRRRLLPAFVYGALSVLAGQALATWLYYSPGWKAVATSIIRLG